MNKEEVTSILAIMKTAYPALYKDMPDEEIDNVINLWSTLFAGDDVKTVTEAVKSLICTLKFPPTIADVKEKITLITQPTAMSEMEAWNKVSGAISYYNAKENFDNLEPLLQKLVGSANQLREWAVMDASVVNSVIQSNFMRSYTARVKSDKELGALPDSTKELISGLAQKFISA